MFEIKKFTVNPLGENSYVIFDESGECIFIDPGFYYNEEKEEIREFVKANKLKPVKIVNTHCHFDHLMGVDFIRSEFDIPFEAHREDEFWVARAVDQGRLFGFRMQPVEPIDNYIADNGQVGFGNSVLKIIHLPGHSPGHVVFYEEKSGFLITGDVLFYGSIGRTDLPGGNYETLLSGIKSKLFVLPDETKVYCGHGQETTLGVEKSTNPFLN